MLVCPLLVYLPQLTCFGTLVLFAGQVHWQSQETWRSSQRNQETFWSIWRRSLRYQFQHKPQHPNQELASSLLPVVPSCSSSLNLLLDTLLCVSLWFIACKIRLPFKQVKVFIQFHRFFLFKFSNIWLFDWKCKIYD